jgi:hypothetical protein
MSLYQMLSVIAFAWSGTALLMAYLSDDQPVRWFRK